MPRLACLSPARIAALALVVVASTAGAQPAAAPPADAAGASPLAEFAWLDGCWIGSVNQRDFREHWMPPRGGMMLGVSHIMMGGKTQSYEYLRIEQRPDGVYYVAVPSGAKEDAFKFTGVTVDTDNERNDRLYTFENPGLEFPQRIIYRHTGGGMLFATVEGKVKGADRQVIYPMRKVDCAAGGQK